MKIFEIGVGEFNQCRTLNYINTDIECYLFEPNPISFKQIEENLGKYSNFKLFNIALGSENKEGYLYIARGSSFLEGVESPEKTSNSLAEEQLQKEKIEIRDIKDFDDGSIDILLLDTEGSEFDIIKNLISRPKQIIVEMYSFGVGYKNPYFDQIMNWMLNNNYKLINQHEDFVFEKNES
jgi:FkbM family methyltransferase